MIRDTFVNLGSASDGQLVGRDYFRDISPNRKQTVELYLSSLNGNEQETANMIAHDLRSDSKPLEKTVVLIPIAAHQESGNIENALQQYADQVPLTPFSVLLFPNSPMESDQAAVQDTMYEIERAKQKHTALDIRSALPHSYEHPRIGTIRRDLWNAVLLLAHYEGCFDDPSADVVGFNHDIDVVRMSPRYVSRVQHVVLRHQLHYDIAGIPSAITRPHSTMLKHAHDPTRPNMAKATFWHDFTDWQRQPNLTYDAGMVIPMSYYAKKGGFEPEVSIGETVPLRQDQTFTSIRGTVIETSPRRFAERLQNHGLDAIWSDDSFGATEKYRVDDTIPDISPLQLENAIVNSLDSAMDTFFGAAIRKYRKTGGLAVFTDSHEKSIEDIMAQLKRKRHLAATVLDRYVGLPHVARMANDYDIKSLALFVVGPED